MTDCPITPPPELVQHWYNVAREHKPDYEFDIATQAARWGADQELEACCAWLRESLATPSLVECFLANRRPKPPSLKEQALEALDRMDQFPTAEDQHTIRRALEALDD